MLNFGPVTRSHVLVVPNQRTTENATLRISITADVVVTGKGTFTNLADVENPSENLVGIANAATQGAVTASQLEARPLLRVGEVLETIPGVVISQHSGEGKANQYYLRGFNLDHGTDFATTVAGMPVNLPSNAHGQGYSDLNFLIPELVSGIQFRKGPYYSDEGDFSAAGSANINYVNRLEHPVVSIGGGTETWGRMLAASSVSAGSGTLLVAGEGDVDDGPWVHPDHFRKLNGVVRYSGGNALNGLSVTAMGYSAHWDSTDQIPERAIADGLVSRFGAIDPTDGGESSRYSGSVDWQHATNATTTKATAYAIRYRLDLFSDFTYFLDDPVNGDQFEQADQRVTTGGRMSHRRLNQWAGHAVQQTIGVQVRHDDIGLLGLFHTKARARLSTTRDDAVNETNGGIFYENEVQWVAKLRTNGGQGFHSNDARGTTLTVDPSRALRPRASPHSFDQRDRRSASAACWSRTGKRPPRSGVSTSHPNSCSRAMQAQRRRAARVVGQASNGRTTSVQFAG